MVDPQIDLLYVDGRMVKQMMINLVGNAIKFSPKGGRIEIKVAPAGDGPGRHVFSVVDHGIGIAKADIPRILKPFEQVETAFARNFDGIGLGLPLVNSMARLHGAISPSTASSTTAPWPRSCSRRRARGRGRWKRPAPLRSWRSARRCGSARRSRRLAYTGPLLRSGDEKG